MTPRPVPEAVAALDRLTSAQDRLEAGTDRQVASGWRTRKRITFG
ncbi:hypothetical protein [Nonomuraea terrae]|nr:hypothetical protein [Nonomuraea terrae]